MQQHTLFYLIILATLSCSVNSATDCDQSRLLVNYEDSCHPQTVTEDIHLGEKFVGAENVERIIPATIDVKR